MSLAFAARLDTPVVTTLEGVRLTVRLQNAGQSARRLPGAEDSSGALSFEFRTPGGELVRHMSGLTEQAIADSARVDPRPTLEQLPPGGVWEWSVDLVSYDLPLPEGDFMLVARYDFEPEKVALASGPFRLRVRDTEILSVVSTRDNPILDSLSLLVRTAQPDGGSRLYLRQYSSLRPLSPLYSQPVDAPSGTEGAVCAAADYFQDDSFDPALRKWVVFLAGDRLHARCFEEGFPTADPPRTAPLPGGRRYLRAAFCAQDDRLVLAFQTHDGRLEAFTLAETALVPVFDHRCWKAPRGPIATTAFAGEFHIAYATTGGLIHERLDLTGALLQRRSFSTRLHPLDLRCDPVDQRVKASFRDGPRGHVLELLSMDLVGDDHFHTRFEKLPLRSPLQEVAFDCDPDGRFHLLVSTATRSLYYCGLDASPRKVAGGADVYFPAVVAAKDVYLGFRRQGQGYGFMLLNHERSPAPRGIAQ